MPATCLSCRIPRANVKLWVQVPPACQPLEHHLIILSLFSHISLTSIMLPLHGWSMQTLQKHCDCEHMQSHHHICFHARISAHHCLPFHALARLRKAHTILFSDIQGHVCRPSSSKTMASRECTYVGVQAQVVIGPRPPEVAAVVPLHAVGRTRLIPVYPHRIIFRQQPYASLVLPQQEVLRIKSIIA